MVLSAIVSSSCSSCLCNIPYWPRCVAAFQLPQQFNNLEQKTSRNQGVTIFMIFKHFFSQVFEFLKNWNHQKMSFPEMHRSLFFLFVRIAFSKFRIPDETLHHTICPKRKKRFFLLLLSKFSQFFMVSKNGAFLQD